jgi:hypothetical protein
MRHILSASAGVAGVALLVVSSVALGSTGGQQAASAGSPISIANRVSATLSADQTFKGKFLMVVDGRTYAGTSTISARVVAMQTSSSAASCKRRFVAPTI